MVLLEFKKLQNIPNEIKYDEDKTATFLEYREVQNGHGMYREEPVYKLASGAVLPYSRMRVMAALPDIKRYMGNAEVSKARASNDIIREVAQFLGTDKEFARDALGVLGDCEDISKNKNKWK